MDITKCDSCKKEMERQEKVGIHFANFNYKNVDLCEKCALPVFKFLKNNKLFQDENKKNKKN